MQDIADRQITANSGSTSKSLFSHAEIADWNWKWENGSAWFPYSEVINPSHNSGGSAPPLPCLRPWEALLKYPPCASHAEETKVELGTHAVPHSEPEIEMTGQAHGALRSAAAVPLSCRYCGLSDSYNFDIDD